MDLGINSFSVNVGNLPTRILFFAFLVHSTNKIVYSRYIEFRITTICDKLLSSHCQQSSTGNAVIGIPCSGQFILLRTVLRAIIVKTTYNSTKTKSPLNF